MRTTQPAEGRARVLSKEMADAINWNQQRGVKGNGVGTDMVVRRACEELVKGETVVIEQVIDEQPHHVGAYQRVNLIRSKLANQGLALQSTQLSDIQSEGLKLSGEDKFVPMYALRVIGVRHT